MDSETESDVDGSETKSDVDGTSDSETESDVGRTGESETESAMPLNREAEFHRGLDAYRAFCHFDAYDIWTVVYKSEENETTRRFLQTLIQVANAMHKVRHNGELRGALHLLERALIKLDDLPDIYAGIDLALFRDATRVCLAEVARLLSIKSVDLANSFLPPLLVAEPGCALEPKSVVPAGADSEKLLAEGFEAYRNRRYFDAQELWEESRRQRPEDQETARELLKALILIASAMQKLHRAKSPAGAAQLLEVALDKLRGASDGTLGIAVAELVADVERIHAEVEEVASQSSAQIDPNHVPQIRTQA
jgi:predicted metal-dependent hydrolase